MVNRSHAEGDGPDAQQAGARTTVPRWVFTIKADGARSQAHFPARRPGRVQDRAGLGSPPGGLSITLTSTALQHVETTKCAEVLCFLPKNGVPMIRSELSTNRPTLKSCGH